MSAGRCLEGLGGATCSGRLAKGCAFIFSKISRWAGLANSNAKASGQDYWETFPYSPPSLSNSIRKAYRFPSRLFIHSGHDVIHRAEWEPPYSSPAEMPTNQHTPPTLSKREPQILSHPQYRRRKSVGTASMGADENHRRTKGPLNICG